MTTGVTTKSTYSVFILVNDVNQVNGWYLTNLACGRNLLDDHLKAWKECHITLVDLVVIVHHYMTTGVTTKLVYYMFVTLNDIKQVNWVIPDQHSGWLEPFKWPSYGMKRVQHHSSWPGGSGQTLYDYWSNNKSKLCILPSKWCQSSEWVIPDQHSGWKEPIRWPSYCMKRVPHCSSWPGGCGQTLYDYCNKLCLQCLHHMNDINQVN